MTSPLTAEFPELAHLSSVPSRSKQKTLLISLSRREDLEELISDPVYFQAMFHSLQCVKDLYRSQAELGMANEAIASTCILTNTTDIKSV